MIQAKIYKLRHKNPKMARLRNQIILDKRLERRYTKQIDILLQERARIKQSITDNKQRLESLQRDKALSQEPEIIGKKYTQKAKTEPIITEEEILRELLEAKGYDEEHIKRMTQRLKVKEA